MSIKSRSKKIARLLEIGGHSEKIEQMKADIANCDSKIQRDYVETYYKKYFKKELIL